MLNKVDFHTHILPDIDDGSKSVQESVEMLKAIKSHDVNIVIATPHFYANKISVSDFLDKRLESTKRLCEAAKEFPQKLDLYLLLGAEAAFYNGISSNEDLKKLCIWGTNVLLLELPFDKINHMIFEEIVAISNMDIIPVIAHCERYLKYKNGLEIFDELIECGAYIQVNSNFFIETFSKSKAMKLLKNNSIHLLGSDCHNLTNRAPNMHLAVDAIRNKLGDDYIKQINKNSSRLLKGAKLLCI